MWIEFGRIQLPQGHHPNDIEKEWGKLIIAMLEREKSLRPEVERYVKSLRVLVPDLYSYYNKLFIRINSPLHSI